MLRAADDIRSIARRAADPDAASLRIGLIPTLAPYLLPHVVPDLHERFPKVELLLVEEKTARSEEHTSELQSLMRTSYAVFCLKKKNTIQTHLQHTTTHLHP